jgi:hypothetical protein
MIEEHTDPTAEAHAQASNLLRTLLTALATVADRRAQRRQAGQERQRHQSEAERRETEKRMESERDAAHLVYRRVYDESWWASASPKKLADAVVAAGAWADQDPRARDAWGELSEQLQARYGIDLEALARQADGAGAPAGKVASEVRGQVEQAQASQADQAPGAKRWEAEVLAAAGAELGAQVIAAKGWHHLQDRLDRYQAAGEDPLAHLSKALAEGELTTANDKSRVLIGRMDHPGRYSGLAGRHPGKHRRPTDAERLAGRRRAEQERRWDEPGRGGED